MSKKIITPLTGVQKEQADVKLSRMTEIAESVSGGEILEDIATQEEQAQYIAMMTSTFALQA